MGGEIFQKLVSIYPTFSFTIVFIFSIFQVFKSTTLSRSIRARQHGIRISRLPASLWWRHPTKCLERNSGNIQIDCIWSFLSEMKNVDVSYRFEKPSKISRLILTVPYSNAEEERIFSMARKKKTCSVQIWIRRKRWEIWKLLS